MSNPIRLSSKREFDSERLAGLIEERKRVRLHLVEIEAEIETIVSRRAATAPAKPRSDRLAYRTADVASLTGLGETTIRKAIDRGDLRSVSADPSVSGSARLILAADLEAWLASLS